VWADLISGFAALAYGAGGLLPIDVRDLHDPEFGRDMLAARPTYDIDVVGSHAFLANLGLKVLDVSNPDKPLEIGSVDTAWYESYSVAAQDSFAYVMWWIDYGLAVVDVSNPADPKLAGGCEVFNMPEAMAVRDSLLYIAEDNRFEVVNIARPRAPGVVGSVRLPNDCYGMDVQDTLAFIANGVSGLQIVSIARPDSPAIAGALIPPNGACGVAVKDTFAYVVSGNLYIASVANPASPYLIDSLVLPTFGWSIAATDSLLFVGSSGYVYGTASDIRLLDIRDPAKPVLHGSLVAPDVVCRLAWAEPHLFAACYQGGVLVVETTAVGLQEPERALRLRGGLRVMPSPVADIVRIEFGEPLGVGSRLGLYDATGRQVLVRQTGKEVASIELRLTGLDSGLYFVRVETKTGVLSNKLVKR